MTKGRIAPAVGERLAWLLSAWRVGYVGAGPEYNVSEQGVKGEGGKALAAEAVCFDSLWVVEDGRSAGGGGDALAHKVFKKINREIL